MDEKSGKERFDEDGNSVTTGDTIAVDQPWHLAGAGGTAMSFPRYERYKDSVVEWLGEVPEGWKVARHNYYLYLAWIRVRNEERK